MAGRAPTKQRYGATAYGEGESALPTLLSLLNKMSKSFQQLHENMEFNLDMLYRVGQAEPNLPEPFKDFKFMTDAVRKAGVDFMSRVTEYLPIVDVKAVGSGDEAASEDEAELWNTILAEAEQRLGYSTQEMLCFDQMYKGFGVLHVYRADQTVPAVPEREYLDEYPEEDDEDEEAGAKRKRKFDADYEEVPEDDEQHGKKKYREKASRLRRRTQDARAKAGSPYQFCVPDAKSILFRPDVAGAAGVVAYIRQIEVLGPDGYKGTLESDDLLLRTVNQKLRIYQKTDPDASDPLTTNGGLADCETVTVCTVWTRDEYYELACAGDKAASFSSDNIGDADWTLVKSGKHGFGRPPFFFAWAEQRNHPDPARRYIGYLAGMCDLTPSYNYTRALGVAIAYDTAIQQHVLVDQMKGGTIAPFVDDQGEPLALSADSQKALELPPGKVLQTIRNDVSQGFVNLQAMVHQDLKDAAPPMPSTEISASTQPWTARLQMQVSGVMAKGAIKAQASAYRDMFRAIANDINCPPEMGGYGEGVWTHKSGGKVIGIEAGAVESKRIDVTINDISGAEQITVTEHGVSLYERGRLTEEDLYDNYMVVENAADYITKLRAESLFNRQLMPGLMAQAVGKRFGGRVIVGTDGQLINFAGQSVDPGAALQQRGWRRPPQPQGPPQGTTMGNLPGLSDASAPPGAIRQPTMAGMSG